MYEENREFMDTVRSDIVRINTPDDRPISTRYLQYTCVARLYYDSNYTEQ